MIKLTVILAASTLMACAAPSANMSSTSSPTSCAGGDAEACYMLGWMVRQGAHMTEQSAVVFFTEACALGHAKACNEAGWETFNGVGTAKDDEAAVAFYTRGCEGLEEKYTFACGNLGHHLFNGIGTAKDTEAAVAHFSYACEGGLIHSCHNLGIAYEQGEGVTQDDARARELYEKACLKNIPGACTNLGVLALTGRGGDVDLPRSIALLDRECEVRDEPWACTSLGYAYNLGLGVETDACKAKALHEKSCALENQLGCANLSDHLIHERCAVRDLKRAETLATKSCEAINRGCASLGWIAETGANAKADKARALALYRKGCSAGDAYACERLGIFFAQGIVVEKDPQAAMEKYEESCRLGRPDACSLALKLASSSKAQPADLAALKARACSFGVGPCP